MRDETKTVIRFEEALKAEHGKLNSILDAMDDGVYIINKDFYIKYANPVLQSGFGPAEGRRCVEYFGIPGMEQPCPCHILQEPISKDEIRGRSEWYSPKNQKTYDVFQTTITIEDGSETYLQIMRDITERKRTEEELRKSEKRFSDIAENAMDWTWETDAKGRYTYSSQVIEKILGYTPEEVLGKYFFDFLHVDEREQTKKRINEIFSKKESFMNFINKKVHKDGRGLICETSGIPVIDKDGRMIGYRGSVKDVTERKLTEEELRIKAHMLNATKDTIFLHNLKGEFIYFNEAAYKTRGYSREELMGMDVPSLNAPGYAERVKENLQRLMEDGDLIVESVHLRKDGSQMPVEIYGRIFESGGKKLVLSVVRDITERKRAEEELDVRARELDNMNKDLHNLAMEMTTLEERERNRFAGVLHDDIGQNLATARLAFSSFTKLCDKCSDAARETMDEVSSLLESTINTIRAMISDLHPVHPYGEELVSKRGLKDAIEWYAKTVLVQSGIELSVDIDGAVEEMPEDFKQNLYRILQECLQNVMKHSKASSIELRCKVEGDRLMVSVKDDGVGFDDIRLKEGGFGLRLMRERVRSMNGILTIRSERGKGTEVLAEFST